MRIHQKDEMKKLLSFLVLAPVLGWGQGVDFETGLSWQQILAKAKAENKYIFVDCYASWCGPCKEMDRDVYPKDSVGQAVNARFVSVKVQIDTSQKDDAAVKAWYADAHKLMITYGIRIFPSYLFFSPDGKTLHREVGYQTVSRFVGLIATALDPAKQFYTQLAALHVNPDGAITATLANQAKYLGDITLADSIASGYLHNYLDKLSREDLLTKANLTFVSRFSKTLLSQEPVFQVIFQNRGLADSIVDDSSFSKRLINTIAAKEEITPKIEEAKADNGSPAWGAMADRIKRKFGQAYVEENIIAAKVKWYQYKQDWQNYTKYLVLQTDVVGVENMAKGHIGILVLNNRAWEIFQYSQDKKELIKAVSWVDMAIQMDPKPNSGILDTKANLLYKLGKKEEAIALEKKSIDLDPGNKELKDDLDKMLHGLPTWVSR